MGGKYDPSYIRFEKKSTVDSSIVGKRVVSKVDNLRFYDSPSWQDKDGAGSVDAGLGFTIDEKLMVKSSLQYRVYNSHGKTFYITASDWCLYEVEIVKEHSLNGMLFL